MTSERTDINRKAGAVRGWSCTPTSEPPPVTIGSEDRPRSSFLPVNLRKGWRKTTLYIILVLLMILVFLNIALTLWIVSALKLTMNGIGPIRIVKAGIYLDGQAWVTDKLVTSSIASRPAQPITLHSHRNFSVLVSQPNLAEHTKLLLKRDVLQCNGNIFQLRDARGAKVFQASREEVRVFADALAVDGIGGINVKSGLQTSFVRAPPGADLQIESLTRRLDLRAPQSILLESRAGAIEITSHNDIKLDSVVGSLKIDASSIEMKNLKEAVAANKSSKNTRGIKGTKVYQLCACASGKLFLAAADGICSAYDDDTELCR